MKQIAQATATILKNVQRGAQIGVLGAALVAGPLMGCANPSDGNTNTYEENTGNNGGNTTGGSGNTNTGNGGDNTGKNRGTPYDKTVGNGSYYFHNFFSDEPNISAATAIEDANYYLSLANPYVQGKIDDFSNSLKGRPNAQAYFKNYITDMTEAKEKLIVNSYGTVGMETWDRGIIGIDEAGIPAMLDVIRNLDGDERFEFVACYRLMEAESQKTGDPFYGTNPDHTNDYGLINTDYSIYLPDINPEADAANNCIQTTQHLDDLLGKAVKNINNANGHDLTVNDFRQVMSMSWFPASMTGAHKTLGSNIDRHNQRCLISLSTIYEMNNLATNLWYEEHPWRQVVTPGMER